MAEILSKSTGQDGVIDAEEAGIGDIQEGLLIWKEKILTWNYDQDPSLLVEYVNEVRQLEEILKTVEFTNEVEEQNKLLKCAQSILHMALERHLPEEFSALLGKFHRDLRDLIQNEQNLDLVSMIFRSPSDENVQFLANTSSGDEPADDGSHSSTHEGRGDNPTDSLFSSTVSNLRSIVNLLFQCNYGEECCQAYICATKVALDNFLSILRMEPISIEGVLKMGWEELNDMINRWKHSVVVFVKVCLASNKRLYDIIFGDIPGSMAQFCFRDASKCSVFQLLSFADAVAISAAKSEKLFQILEMYEVLDGFLIDIENFYPNEYGLSISNEYRLVLSRLRDSIKTIMNVFKRDIQTNTSTAAFPRAAVHTITKYVMNFIKALASYSETINFLLSDQPNENHYSASGNHEESPFSLFLKSVTVLLESNLDANSRLYNNDAMSSVFLMNNMCYLVQKIKDSDLCHFVTDEWICAHIAKFQRHARDYQRASWTSVVSYLVRDGNLNSGSLPMKDIKKRFKGFNNAFEAVYRTQTGWLVADELLREDLRISISSVLQAYRVFLGRYADYLEHERNKDKYIKYWADDLEEYLLHLFEGSERSLN